ncbi:MAG TPA: TonB family protein [Longimicrobium sp.]|nr:TonB family protein [Longimicrobium sp.]
MFKVITERKRRLWSPRTVAASVLVHAVLAAGFVMAIRTVDRPVEEEAELVDFPIEQDEPERREPERPAPQPEESHPRGGQTVKLPAPETVLDSIPEQEPHLRPLLEEHVTGVGQVGAVFARRDPNPALPIVSTPEPGENLPIFYAPIPADSADVQPELANRRQAEMILQRNYPPLLRDVGAMGRTTVLLIIDQDGKVEPGSVRVQESTHDAFKDAAVRAVEQFRFRPAMLNKQRVAVLVTLPITWRLEY